MLRRCRASVGGVGQHRDLVTGAGETVGELIRAGWDPARVVVLLTGEENAHGRQPKGFGCPGPSTRELYESVTRSLKDMVLEGDYEPSRAQWVREQVEAYERSGGQRANTLRDTGLPVVIVTMRGNKSGKVRKIALMRVEHEGEYALVASMGGAPRNPVWYHNLKADPEVVTIQDGPEAVAVRVREVDGDERAAWWERAVAAYPPYAEYQTRTDREIPVFVATRA
jgi:deazaflavin-dependent oxidoreductase (nitroreductase family)